VPNRCNSGTDGIVRMEEDAHKTCYALQMYFARRFYFSEDLLWNKHLGNCAV